MAVRGLQAYAVPSARAGQQPDPSARREVLSGLLTVGFLVAVVAIILAIIVATPEYAVPAPATAADPATEAQAQAVDPALPEAATVSTAVAEQPTSAPPGQLKGYRWPVSRSGMVLEYYDWDKSGRFIIDGRPVHAGLVISWFPGAPVKAAHAGEVVAAGRDWSAEVGYDGALGKKARQGSLGVVIDDGNGYRSVYSVLGEIRVKVGDKVKAGTSIGTMGRDDGQAMMRYELVRMDGAWLTVRDKERKLGYPAYVREHVDPLAVLDPASRRSPDTQTRRPPARPPRLSDY